MKTKLTVFLAIALLVPCIALAQVSEHLHTVVMVISALNTVLVITSAISILQFIRHKNHNRTPFQAFNLIFIILFYSFSIPFLLHHKDFFIGFGELSDAECIKKYFLANEPESWIRKIVVVAFVLNIIYIARFAKTYYLE